MPGNAGGEPACVADEAGSQPAGTGGSTYATAIALSRLSIQSDERPIPGPRQELCINQGPEECIAHIAIEAPQALRLRRGQAKTWHFYEFALYPLEHVIDTHS
jgi:hypothetical protein